MPFFILLKWDTKTAKCQNTNLIQDRQLIEISTSTILRTIIIVGALVFLYVIRDVLVILFLALIIVSAINPIVTWLQKKKLPRIFGVLFVYIIGLLILSTIVYIVVPPLAQEVRDLSKNLPDSFSLDYYETQYDFGSDYPEIAENIKLFLGNISQRLEFFSSSLMGAAINLFGGIISMILILVISFYLSVQEEGIKNFFRSLIPIDHQPYVFHLWSRTEFKMGRWLQGQFLLGLLVGLLTFTGLSILGVEYALVLAIIAGLFELIPYVGPVLAAVPAVIFGGGQSLTLGLWVIFLYIFIQQLENHVLVPKVMQRAVSLNPIIIIIAILTGAKLAGFVGILIAVPVAAILAEVFYDVTEHEYWKWRPRL